MSNSSAAGRHRHVRLTEITKRTAAMTEYLITIPGDEAVWDARTQDDNTRVGNAHRDFVATLTARGHRVIAGGELTALAAAKVVRGSGSRYGVTDGPYAETNEQMGGFYLVESADLDGLLEVCGALSLVEPVVEVRPVVARTEGA
jgi:hypothetical protein